MNINLKEYTQFKAVIGIPFLVECNNVLFVVVKIDDFTCATSNFLYDNGVLINLINDLVETEIYLVDYLEIPLCKCSIAHLIISDCNCNGRDRFNISLSGVEVYG